MSHDSSPRQFRDEIVGRTIAGVIARPGRGGEPPVVLMMRFDDGSVIEFVSPRSDRLLKRSLRRSVSAVAEASAGPDRNESQLTLDGLLATGSIDEASGRCGFSSC
ncbi:hypothetical protein [Wenzhouxiangella limi]|uniref:Uncharacterized protein n=1 Tax=Wenzhouxiangella limi TaxID=2707351 RepID=A0A845V100_9GAMM|nr:hypothetical protein [Wenzhouxiangella limi]NDY96748.1 hypothetical protein [Wenzhouxiangella limi]